MGRITCSVIHMDMNSACTLCISVLPYSSMCIACGCYPNGTDGVCDSAGRCSCKVNVQGLMCESCVSGFWNLSVVNPLGCQGTFNMPRTPSPQAKLIPACVV